jgi:putative peptide zinc metalloprotease protein
MGQAALTGCDAWFSRLYSGMGARRLFTGPALAAAGAVALAGLIAFLLGAGRGWHAVQEAGPASLAWPLLPLGILALLGHELGHAFTVKAFGRQVDRVGLGWYWITPVFFVDTSDMWLCSKWPRAAVSAAGLCVNLALAGLSALLATAVDGEALAVLWLFSLLSYAVVVLNLNPLMESDGYHLLSDLLDRPNLRREAMARLRLRA